MSLRASPGAYALLVGSGLSRSAGVPTAQQIVEDLIRQVGAAKKAKIGSDPLDWFRKRFGEEPLYGPLLEMLAPAAAERGALLAKYFERGLGDTRPEPTVAHRAIAELVDKGYIRVIITPNFDRLFEQALQAQGIEPVIVRGASTAVGLGPITQRRCILVKVNGDYLDFDPKNTPAELATYLPELEELLRRIASDHGLIICGWSAEHDGALRAAIEQSATKRYSVYWATRTALTDRASELAQFLEATLVDIQGADEFFAQLAERVIALEELEAEHPLTRALAVATVRRHVGDATALPQLQELLAREAELVAADLRDRASWPGVQSSNPNDQYLAELRQYEVRTRTLMEMLATVARFGLPAHRRLVTETVERLLNFERGESRPMAPTGLDRYPALLLHYAAGITALAFENWPILAGAVLDTEIRSANSTEPGTRALMAHEVLNEQRMKAAFQTPEGKTWLWPNNEYLMETVRAAVRDHLPDEPLYRRWFDRFEYVLSLLQYDLDRDRPFPIFGLGKFSYKLLNDDPAHNPIEWLNGVISLSLDWDFLTAGAFGGDFQRLNAAKMGVDGYALRNRRM